MIITEMWSDPGKLTRQVGHRRPGVLQGLAVDPTGRRPGHEKYWGILWRPCRGL